MARSTLGRWLRFGVASVEAKLSSHFSHHVDRVRLLRASIDEVPSLVMSPLVRFVGEVLSAGGDVLHVYDCLALPLITLQGPERSTEYVACLLARPFQCVDDLRVVLGGTKANTHTGHCTTIVQHCRVLAPSRTTEGYGARRSGVVIFTYS